MSEFNLTRHTHEHTPKEFHPLLDLFVDPADKLLVFSWIQRYLTYEARGTDDLTKLENSGRWWHNLSEALDKNRSETMVVVLDATNFKHLNDSAGHSKGDDMLRTIADRLRIATRRSSDHIARLGGDEFGIIMDTSPRSRDVNMTKDERVARNIGLLDSAFEEMHAEYPEIREKYRVDIAYGVAVPSEFDSPEDVFRMAELRMEQMKEVQKEALGFRYRTGSL